MKRNLLLLIAVAIVLIAGCSDSPAETTTTPPAPSTTTTLQPATTSTTAPPAVTTTAASPLPDNPAAAAAEQFDTTGDDLVAVMQAWHEMIRFFAQNPVGSAEEMVDLMYTPVFFDRGLLLERFAELVDNGWRYIDPGTTLWGLKVVELGADRAVVLEAIERGATTGYLQIVGDAEGNQVKTYDGFPLRIRELHLVRDGADGRWRLDDVPVVDVTVELSTLEVLEFDWIGEDL